MTLYGIHWAGPGTEVQRADDDSTYPGDMEAALAVAEHTDARWLLYSEQPGEPWAVVAHSNLPAAIDEYRERLADGLTVFLFDGRRGTQALEDGPEGIGYRCPTPDGDARRIAAAWMEGKRDPLAAFATTGAISADLSHVISTTRAWATLNGYGSDAREELVRLRQYVEAAGERGPIEGWAALWEDASAASRAS
ncbi:MAG: hypothetical protein JHD16_00130 [Solirubrobacteraceae bacterium]|nr:hypothetical protein [Solirubrobacteraceae bacterium]